MVTMTMRSEKREKNGDCFVFLHMGSLHFVVTIQKSISLIGLVSVLKPCNGLNNNFQNHKIDLCYSFPVRNRVAWTLLIWFSFRATFLWLSPAKPIRKNSRNMNCNNQLIKWIPSRTKCIDGDFFDFVTSRTENWHILFGMSIRNIWYLLIKPRKLVSSKRSSLHALYLDEQTALQVIDQQFKKKLLFFPFATGWTLSLMVIWTSEHLKWIFVNVQPQNVNGKPCTVSSI